MSILQLLLSSKVRAEIFRILFGVNANECHMRELERGAGCTIGPVQTELKKLLAMQLVTSRRSGNRLYYRANRAHPLYPEIHSLVLKTSGLCDYLKECLSLRDDIDAAFVFGSLADGSDGATSDIDLMVVGSIGLRQLSTVLVDFRATVGREVNPHVLSREEFARRRTAGEHFIGRVFASPRLFVKGTENDLAEMG
jgi:predicted nucleotidyltransferase